MFSCQSPYLSGFPKADFENMVIYFKNESLLKIQALEKETVTPGNRFISVRNYEQNTQITEQIM